ncbi:MAG: DUF3108 domain-containing protein [Pyrinomonadaceae bacterium]
MTTISIPNNLVDRRKVLKFAVAAVLLLIVAGWFAFFGENASAKTISVPVQSSAFRIGEKLSYSVSFGKFQNAGYAETFVVSSGKIAGKDAVEIRSKIKTLELVSAAFFQFDESRTVYAAPDTCLPLYVRTNSNNSVIPKETIRDHLSLPSSDFDLLTLIFKARDAGGVGTYPLLENDNLYNVTFVPTVAEKVKTQVGDFDTQVSTVQSDFLVEHDIKDLRINFSTDEFRVPVLIRFKTGKGEFKATLAGIVLPEPETPTPTATPTASPVATPPPVKPTPTPDTYVENRPLSPELGFQIGESLDYRISSAGQSMGVLTLSVPARKRINNLDTLFLTATVTAVEPGATQLRLGDSVTAQVDPETLATTAFEAKLSTLFPGLNPSAAFDFRTGTIKFGANESVDAPIGTYSVLSMIYAMRSFNLKPSKNASNPVNDTRVAVFWDSMIYIFTLRPSEAGEITLNGQPTPSQLITINSGNKPLDQLAPKVWLSPEQRVPLRFSLGAYQADLIVRNATLFR